MVFNSLGGVDIFNENIYIYIYLVVYIIRRNLMYLKLIRIFFNILLVFFRDYLVLLLFFVDEEIDV